jgi:SAM-dependent methyltransferase
MNAADYNAWYDAPCGRRIGATEFGLIRRMLDPRPGESLLDVGCGTGWFTRRMGVTPRNWKPQIVTLGAFMLRTAPGGDMPKKAVVALQIEKRIYQIRGKRVLLDEDLARLYQATTKAFNQAIKRNIERFPDDFMFQLTPEEYSIVRSQIVTTSGKGGRRALPRAFTEHGAVMAATVLNSPLAIEASIMVVRAFIHLRELIAEHTDLKGRLDGLERRLAKRFADYEEELREIRFIIARLEQPVESKRRPLGFRKEKD